MARIRSVHPGLFTDEAFMGLSSDAQIFLIGLYTESDDQGIFEWKPVTLRARLRPAKDGSVDAILAELQTNNCVLQYEMSGRKYGAVRNFRKYQRPKKPNAIHPTTDQIRTYVALSGSSSEPDDDEEQQVPQKAEISPQMEEVGGRRKEITEEAKASSAATAAVPKISDASKPDWWPKRDRYGRVLGEITDKLAYDVGKAVLGLKAGGQITKLRKAYRGDWRAVIELLLRADETSDPPSWFASALRKAEMDEPIVPAHEIYRETEYRT